MTDPIKMETIESENGTVQTVGDKFVTPDELQDLFASELLKQKDNSSRVSLLLASDVSAAISKNIDQFVAAEGGETSRETVLSVLLSGVVSALVSTMAMQSDEGDEAKFADLVSSVFDELFTAGMSVFAAKRHLIRR